jgi:hypothetical protein
VADAGSVEVAINATLTGFQAGLADSIKMLNDAGPMLGKAAAAASAAIVAGLALSINAYADAERSATGLGVAIRNTGDFSRDTLGDLLNYADALSQMSRFTHDEIEASMTFLATQGLKGDALKTATQAAVDLATQTGNLTMATRLLGNAYEGTGTGLRRYGIILEQGTPPALMYAEALAQIQEKFGGRAAADAETLGGQIADLTKIMTQFTEHVGQALAPTIKDITSYLLDHKDELLQFADDLGQKIVDLLNSLTKLINFVTSNWGLIQKIFTGAMVGGITGLAAGPAGFLPGAAIGAMIELGVHDAIMKDTPPTAGAQLPTLSGGASGNAAMAAGVSKNLNAQAQGMWMFGNSPMPDTPSKFQAAWQQAYQKVFSGAGVLSQQIESIMKGMVSALASGISGFFKGILMEGQNLGQALMNIGTSMLNFVFDTIAKMAAEWIAKHIIMAAISKIFNLGVVADSGAASVAQIGINKATSLAMIPAIMGVTDAELVQAYAGIPFVGPAMSATAIGVANSQIAVYAGMIAAADGGIFNGPTPAWVGEAGKEAVLPLTGSRGRDALREIGAGAMGGSDSGGKGGGDTHIHIQGTLVEGSAASWERLVRNVIVPALEKNGRKTRRTRGTTW